MKHTTSLTLALILPLLLLAGCGDADVPTAMAASVELSPAPDLVPMFDADGRVVRDDETGRQVVALRDGADLPTGLLPVFDADGLVKRCPQTGAPLCITEDDDRLVRMPR